MAYACMAHEQGIKLPRKSGRNMIYIEVAGFVPYTFKGAAPNLVTSQREAAELVKKLTAMLIPSRTAGIHIK